MKCLYERFQSWSTLTKFFFTFSLLFLFTRLILSAWVTEDAYITFRVLDNFVNGYGLRWNIDERVQAFTNPLWLLIHAPFYAVTNNIFLTTIAISLFFSIGAALLLIRIADSKPLAIACAFLLLASSKAWREYAISGLENPLNFFLLGCFFIRLVFYPLDKKNLFWLALLTALIGFNRLDAMLLLLPLWLWIIWRHGSLFLRTIPQMMIAVSPMVLWLAFSFFYYGFFFPNTRYAKLSTGIPAGEYLEQGMWYALDFIVYDLVGFMLLSLATIYTLKSRNEKTIFFSAGVWLYCLYTVLIGGDFMSGRFFSIPIYASVLLIILKQSLLPARFLAVFSLLSVITASIQPSLAKQYWANNSKDIFPHGICDERDFYVWNWLIYPGQDGYNIRNGVYFSNGIRQNPSSAPQKPTVSIQRNIGVLGYNSDRTVIIIDKFALSDPLLARLPAIYKKHWRIGHFRRNIPEGYKYARETGDLSKMEPNIREYYQKLRYITTGDLWDSERIMTAINFNLGKYDHYRAAYLNQELKK